MTPDQIREAFVQCYKALKKEFPSYEPVELENKSRQNFMPRTGIAPGHIGHLMWMCSEGCELVTKGSVEKANRWLGFVQGALWMAGLASIDEMREWNKPAPAAVINIAAIRKLELYSEDEDPLERVTRERDAWAHQYNLASEAQAAALNDAALARKERDAARRALTHVGCPGFEVEPGVWSGCEGGADCPTCAGGKP